MREIKFRAWDKKKKEWFKGDDGAIGWTGDHLFQLDGILNFKGMQGANGFEFMQYTGLKDKNEKPVYEGDIVKTDSETRIVEWGFRSADGEAMGYAIYDIDEDTEVIGNVWENGDLLK